MALLYRDLTEALKYWIVYSKISALSVQILIFLSAYIPSKHLQVIYIVDLEYYESLWWIPCIMLPQKHQAKLLQTWFLQKISR